MDRPITFKGKIQFFDIRSTESSNNLKYEIPDFHENDKDDLTATMMANFQNLNLTTEEKKHLSRSHRKILNYYRHLNLFSLNQDANKLIAEINKSKQTQILIEASHYGAYVCLAALYSGKILSTKKVEFFLENAPLALFPKSMMKVEPANTQHKINFKICPDCWLSPFSTLYKNLKIKYSLKKAA